MNQYTIPAKQRTLLLVGMVVGAVCLGLTWFADDELHTRFWTNFLHNAVFFTGISFMAAFFISVCITAWAGWHTVFKRIWEALAMFLPFGFVMMLIIALGTFFHWHHLYHWADFEPSDAILTHKSQFLNTTWYFISVIMILVWYLFIKKIRNLSIAEDESGDLSFTHHHNQRKWAAPFLAIAGFSSAMVIWLWIMSLDGHWYSTMFAWYTGASWFVSMICVTLLMIIYLKGKGYLANVSGEHVHDLGKFLFAFSIFWTYLWFSQFMLIWYANVGEETVYFKDRMDNYPVLFYGNLAINFLLPFFVLMRNDTKRKFGSVSFVAFLVLFGHWWDFFQMIKPGALHTAHAAMSHGDGGHGHAAHAPVFQLGYTLPGFLEIGTFIGFLCLFLYVTYSALAKAALLPKNDPYLQESLHHHV